MNFEQDLSKQETGSDPDMDERQPQLANSEESLIEMQVTYLLSEKIYGILPQTKWVQQTTDCETLLSLQTSQWKYLMSVHYDPKLYALEHMLVLFETKEKNK